MPQTTTTSLGPDQRSSRRWFGPEGRRYLFLLPALVLTLGTLAYPLAYNFVLGFYETNSATLANTFVGVTNYVDLITSGNFLAALWRTLVYSVVSSVLAVIFGVGVALVVHHIDLPLKSLMLGLLFIPWIMSPVEVALIGKWLVHPVFGPLNAAMVAIGVLPKGTSLLGQPSTALWTIIAVYTWKHIPFVMIAIYAALQTLPQQVYEAARLDGAGPLRLFRYVTLPLLRPVMVTTGLLIIIWQFGSYAVFDIMTGGGPRGSTEVLSIFIVDTFNRRYFGESAAVSTVLFIVASILTILYLRFEFRHTREE